MAVSLRGLNVHVRRAAQSCLDEFRRQYGFSPTITSTKRTMAQQLKLYRRWLAGLSPWPANPPGQSGHQYGLAWDSWVPDQYMAAWTAIRKAAGFHVPVNDVIHAEVPSWGLYVHPRPKALGAANSYTPTASPPAQGSRVLGLLRAIGRVYGKALG